MIAGAAIVYALLAETVALFHAALAFGAPWGHLTMGGRWQGRLPREIRLLSLLQMVLIEGMALAMLDAGGVLPLGLPAWCGWAALALTALTTVANLVTPSRPERLLWGPVTVVMLITGTTVMLGA